MKFEKLFSLFLNLTLDTKVLITEEGWEYYESNIKDVYYELSERGIQWFYFEDGVLVIKLKKKEDR